MINRSQLLENSVAENLILVVLRMNSVDSICVHTAHKGISLNYFIYNFCKKQILTSVPLICRKHALQAIHY